MNKTRNMSTFILFPNTRLKPSIVLTTLTAHSNLKKTKFLEAAYYPLGRNVNMMSKQYPRTIIILIFTISFFSQVLAINKITAKYLLNTADSLAVTLASNAELGRLESSSIDTTGKSDSWTFVYYSFDLNHIDSSKAYYFFAQNNQVTFDYVAPLGVGAWILIDGWLDSDSVLSIAETAGGSDIRKQFPACTITASLFQWSYPPFISEWQINYNCIDDIRTLHINATTGGVVTSVKEFNNQVHPNRFELCQNYPNPFNPSTVIRYELPNNAHIRLVLFDVLGRQLKTLVDEEKSAGTYKVEFDADGLSSGVYFYQLQSNEFTQTKKLILTR